MPAAKTNFLAYFIWVSKQLQVFEVCVKSVINLKGRYCNAHHYSNWILLQDSIILIDVTIHDFTMKTELFSGITKNLECKRESMKCI